MIMVISRVIQAVSEDGLGGRATSLGLAVMLNSCLKASWMMFMIVFSRHCSAKLPNVGSLYSNNNVYYYPQPDTSFTLQDHVTDMVLVYRAVCLFTPQFSLALIARTNRDGQAELTWVAGYIPRWFTRPKTVTHPSTNRAGRTVTSLIETNALPLSQTATIRACRKHTSLSIRLGPNFQKNVKICPKILLSCVLSLSYSID